MLIWSNRNKYKWWVTKQSKQGKQNIIILISEETKIDYSYFVSILDIKMFLFVWISYESGLKECNIICIFIFLFA